LGEVVNVRPGFARNYLLPQKKALRATDDNRAYFDSQRDALEKVNNEKKAAAEKEAKKLNALTVAMVRQASEGGQLYGSVTARDISELISTETDVKITRGMIDLNQNFKMLGLFDVVIALHPEVMVTVTLNIARSMDEAAIQQKTGKAMIAADEVEAKPAQQEEVVAEDAETQSEGNEEEAAA
jgi:large subunit ribosomal protein L9